MALPALHRIPDVLTRYELLACQVRLQARPNLNQ
jgi:hypothetical protein